MKHIKEFSRYAHSYDAHTVIQKEVAKKLVSMIEGNPQNILDLGCGSGAIYNNLPFTCKNFIGVDSAKAMCELHVKKEGVRVLNENFDDDKFLKNISRENNFNLIISSSALQWAKDLEKIVSFAKNNSENILFGVFTSNTFDTIFKLTGLKSPLPTTNEIIDICEKYFELESEVCTYKLHFEDALSMFRYIKRSGVSGGEKKLSITQTRRLISDYPLDYLEFEVIYIKNK